uniref:Uncharacterized protein n=1 Tax=Schlesneria paludicola TaxID=360056 RepID=A0A7C2JWZ2_9PLAN
MLLRCLLFTAALAAALLSPVATFAVTPRVATRVFFQDDDARTLKWADVSVGDAVTLGSVSEIDGFPKLDAGRQALVQMAAASGLLLVGVRDDDDGAFQSGWVLVDTGVEEEEHGDHSHWRYPRPPRVRAMQLDDQQGNPAHLYCYDGVFYLANDRKNGFTRLDPQRIKPADDAAGIRQQARFIPGGGGHITLAVTNRSLGLATWIDGDGPNKGRVDISVISPNGSAAIAGSIHLPHGGLHGATACQGKAFFAPADGVCWIDTGTTPVVDPKQVTIHHLSLGKVNDKPLRTGAFQTFGRHVAFTTGAGPHTAVCFADASRPQIELIRVPLAMAEGNRAVGPYLVQPRKGSPLGFVFHDHPAGVDAPNRLTILELDPNGDGQWSDAKTAMDLDVGKSRVEGHSGHHHLDFDADRRRGVFSNPGDGTLVVFSLDDRKPVAELSVGGAPTKIVAVGGRASAH